MSFYGFTAWSIRITRMEIDDKTWLFFFFWSPLQLYPNRDSRAESAFKMLAIYFRLRFSGCSNALYSGEQHSILYVCMMFSYTTVFVFLLPKLPAIAHFSGQPFLTPFLCSLKYFTAANNVPPVLDSSLAVLCKPPRFVRPVSCFKMRHSNNQLEAVSELLQGFHTFFSDLFWTCPGWLLSLTWLF